MALRPEIGMNPAQANLTTVLPLFQAAREAKQRRDLMPLEQQINQQEVEQGQLRTSQDVLNLDEGRRSDLIGSMVQGASEVKVFTDRNDIPGAIQQLQSRRELLVSRNMDTTQTDQAIQLAQSNPAQFKNSVDSLVQAGVQGGIISGGATTTGAERSKQRNLQVLQQGAFDEGGKLKPREELTAEQEIAAIEERLIPPAVGSSAQTLARDLGVTVEDAQRRIEASKKRGSREETRDQNLIDSGIDAARAMPTIKRALDLLDTVETGGFSAASLRIKQFFGVEGEDEGELSANLGKAVLSQLRATFGAAFTEREGARLERIEAGFSRNEKTNKRLLNNLKQILEREIKSGRGAATRTGNDAMVQEFADLSGFELETPPQQGAQTPQGFDLEYDPTTGTFK